MNLSKYRCVVCEQSVLRAYSTYWQCQSCRKKYSTVKGIPRLYVEESLGPQDRELRDWLYDGVLGKYYQKLMPFLALPVRPSYWKGWLAYGLIVTALLALLGYVANVILFASWRLIDVMILVLFAGISCFLLGHRYLLYLLILAIPVKISLLFSSFEGEESFIEVHERLIEQLQRKNLRLEVLDIATGTCNSLYRHGWMRLNARYTGIDLSQTMLMKGVEYMAQKQVAMEFVLGDAANLPFASETFDVVLNYGALNGYTDPSRALNEMARVSKEAGLVLFLDEQLYEAASLVEKVYFRLVLSGHNLINRCPVELIPTSLSDIKVHQVYQFYYLCTCYKTTNGLPAPLPNR
jgi:hypothetical protein